MHGEAAAEAEADEDEVFELNLRRSVGRHPPKLNVQCRARCDRVEGARRVGPNAQRASQKKQGIARVRPRIIKRIRSSDLGSRLGRLLRDL